MKAKIRCINSYRDIELNKDIPLGYEWIVDKKRADELLKNPYHLIEVLEYIKEEKPKEKAIKPKKNVETREYVITDENKPTVGTINSSKVKVGKK